MKTYLKKCVLLMLFTIAGVCSAQANIDTHSNTQTPNINTQELLSKTPTPGTILKETIDQETKAVILELGNGAKVILKQTTQKDYKVYRDCACCQDCKVYKDGEITLCALAKGGTMAVTDKEDIPSARFADEMLNVSGIGPYSYKETKSRLLGKEVHLQTNIYAFERSLKGWSSVKDIKTFFEMIYLMFTNQKFDTGEVKSLIEEDKKYHSCDDDNEIGKVFYGDSHLHFDVLHMNHQSRSDFLNEESETVFMKHFRKSDYLKINPKRALEFVKRCSNPADFTFVFVGNIDVETFKTYIKTYIASIPKSTPLINQKFVRPKPSKREIVYIDRGKSKEGKSNAYTPYVTVHMTWVVDEKYSQKLKAATRVLTEYKYIENRPRYLIKSSYNTEVEFSPFTDELSMCVRLSCNAQRIKDHISAIFKDIQNIAKGNIDTDILKKAKEETSRSILNNASNNEWYNGTVADSYACSAVLYNSSLDEFEKILFDVEAVTKQDLKDIASRLLKGKHYQLVLHYKSINL